MTCQRGTERSRQPGAAQRSPAESHGQRGRRGRRILSAGVGPGPELGCLHFPLRTSLEQRLSDLSNACRPRTGSGRVLGRNGPLCPPSASLDGAATPFPCFSECGILPALRCLGLGGQTFWKERQSCSEFWQKLSFASSLGCNSPLPWGRHELFQGKVLTCCCGEKLCSLLESDSVGHSVLSLWFLQCQ